MIDSEILFFFTKTSLIKKKKIIIYGLINPYVNLIIKRLKINTDKKYSFFVKDCQFYVIIEDEIENFKYNISNINFILSNDQVIHFKNLELEFPFEKCQLNLNKNTSAIISTMCKDYSHRLEEWIEYNIKLGFSGIVIFNNNENDQNGLHESLDYTISNKTTQEICNKFKEKVILIDFPYKNIMTDKGSLGHWNILQRLTLTIGVNAFKNKCKYIALIDADEFIFLPSKTHIENFLNFNNSTILSKSHLITNRNNNDIINNNVLKLAKYFVRLQDTHGKVILNTNTIEDNEFMLTSHEHKSQIILENDIFHYHVWLNERCIYNENMKEVGSEQFPCTSESDIFRLQNKNLPRRPPFTCKV